MKSILITGCSAGGIGAGLAEVFQKKGYHVFATVRNPAKVPPNLSKAPKVTILILDVLSTESIAAAVDSVKKETGGLIDVLVNNSGQNLVVPALDLNIEDGRKLFDLNFFAPPTVLFHYKTGMYDSSKSALIMASDIWRRELEPLGVRTLTLTTTSVKTPAFDNVEMPKVPETSYYYVIRDYIYCLADGRLQDGAPLTYDLRVVSEVDKDTTGETWVGKDARMNHWAWRLLPKSVFESIMDGFLKVSAELAKVSDAMKTRK